MSRKRQEQAIRASKCTTKVPHEKKYQAKLAAKALRRKRPYFKFEVYQCPFCQKWHVGKPQRLIQIIDNIHILTKS